MSRYAALIVGAGLFGATCAARLVAAGKKVLVVEQRGGVGGNCADEVREGQIVSLYGGHIFHTSDARLWAFACTYGAFRPTEHTKLATKEGKAYSFPINLLTLHQLWGVTTEAEARQAIEERRYRYLNPEPNMEAWCLHNIGPELYETFIVGYTRKQWGKWPSALPSSIVRRLPVRFTWDTRMFDDTYQGVPEAGYSAWIGAMLDGAEVRLGVDYLADRERLDALADVTIYSGPLDALYGECFGPLDYRSLRFEYTTGPSLGVETMNYTGLEVDYTRKVDFALIRREHHPRHVVMTEHPSADGPPMYPVRDAANTARYEQYAALAAREPRLIVGGRLGRYVYSDMAPTIAEALKKVEAVCA